MAFSLVEGKRWINTLVDLITMIFQSSMSDEPHNRKTASRTRAFFVPDCWEKKRYCRRVKGVSLHFRCFYVWAPSQIIHYGFVYQFKHVHIVRICFCTDKSIENICCTYANVVWHIEPSEKRSAPGVDAEPGWQCWDSLGSTEAEVRWIRLDGNKSNALVIGRSLIVIKTHWDSTECEFVGNYFSLFKSRLYFDRNQKMKLFPALESLRVSRRRATHVRMHVETFNWSGKSATKLESRKHSYNRRNIYASRSPFSTIIIIAIIIIIFSFLVFLVKFFLRM